MVQPAKLNREMIVREAIALLQEGGLEALTLRRLADRLGVRAPSLARHVGDKGQLVALVSATIFLDALDSVPPGLAGADWLLAYGRALRAKQAATRDVTALIAAAPRHPEMEQEVAARLHAAMVSAGLAGPVPASQQVAIQALVTGWMLFEKSARGDQLVASLPQGQGFDAALAALVAGFGRVASP